MMSTPEAGMDKLDINEHPEHQDQDEEDTVDPWTVQSSSEKGIDYEKLVSKGERERESNCNSPKGCMN